MGIRSSIPNGTDNDSKSHFSESTYSSLNDQPNAPFVSRSNTVSLLYDSNAEYKSKSLANEYHVGLACKYKPATREKRITGGLIHVGVMAETNEFTITPETQRTSNELTMTPSSRDNEFRIEDIKEQNCLQTGNPYNSEWKRSTNRIRHWKKEKSSVTHSNTKYTGSGDNILACTDIHPERRRWPWNVSNKSKWFSRSKSCKQKSASHSMISNLQDSSQCVIREYGDCKQKDVSLLGDTENSIDDPISVNAKPTHRSRRNKSSQESASTHSLKLLIQTLKTDSSNQTVHLGDLKEALMRETEIVCQLETELNVARSTGLKLENANGRYIVDSMKYKYLKTDIEQLTIELERARRLSEVKEAEKRDLIQELERLQTVRAHWERQCQEASLESDLATEQLRDANEKCSSMEVYCDEELQLRKMLFNIQAALGRLRVIVSLRPTVHESCMKYVSSSEITFFPPPHVLRHYKDANRSKLDGTPVLCRLSHVVRPGLCNSLELYNESSTTIDGVADGLNACFVSLGPRYTGKSTTIFGNIECRGNNNIEKNQKQLHRIDAHDDEKKQFEQILNSTTINQMDLSHSKEFAKSYGFLGLSLLHLLQNLNLRALVDLDMDDATAFDRDFHISMAVVLIPLDRNKPEFDLLSNQTMDFAEPAPASTFSVDRKISGCSLEYLPVHNVSDLMRVCNLIHRRIKRCALQRDRYDHEAINNAHKVVLIRVQFRYNLQDVVANRLNHGGLLVLIDTVGLDNTIQPENTTDARSDRAWKDIACLARVMCHDPPLAWFEQSRLSRMIQPCLLNSRIPGSLPTRTACTLLLHLPCDRSMAYVTMQCLRLGLWVLQLDEAKHDAQEPRDSMTPSDPTKGQVTCVWCIGQIGYAHRLSSIDNFSCSVRNFGGSVKHLDLKLPTVWTKPIEITPNDGMNGSLPNPLQRTWSFG